MYPYQILRRNSIFRRQRRKGCFGAHASSYLIEKSFIVGGDVMPQYCPGLWLLDAFSALSV